MSNKEQQVIELLDSVLDGTASDEERRRFAQLVEDRRDVTAKFIEQLRMHSLLRWKSDQLSTPAPQLSSLTRED